jgi:hypothetical protein
MRQPYRPLQDETNFKGESKATSCALVDSNGVHDRMTRVNKEVPTAHEAVDKGTTHPTTVIILDLIMPLKIQEGMQSET